MAANTSSNPSSSKAASSVSCNPSAAFVQIGPTSGGDVPGQKRSGGSGSFGPGSITRSGAAPRNKQLARGQHKQSKRWKFTDEYAIAESAAMSSTRNRKGQTSITHLMSFALPPRPSSYQQYHSPRQGKRNPTWGLGSGYHSTDKARYIHANYRFIVDPSRDYHLQSVDADLYLDWNSIVQILASPLSQAAACPICLGDPVAPRMAKCGHIFCLHCLIRYMHSNADSYPAPEKRTRWKRCPICDDSVYIAETRPVRWYVGQEGPPPRDNEDIVLRLVMRPAGSTLALPRDTQPMGKDEEVPWHFAADVMDFARVMKGSRDYMLAQFADELAQIEELERHDEVMYGEDNEWTSKATRTVKDAMQRAKNLDNPPANDLERDRCKPRKGSLRIELIASEALEVHSSQLSASSPHPFEPRSPNHGLNAALQESSGSVLASSPASNDVSASVSSEQQNILQGTPYRQRQSSDYYFYQALLQHYLSPLDIRILKAAFIDYSQFPSTILPRVEHVSTGHVVDDDLRRRTKYLAHLPHGCEVSFLECDWTDTVSAEILERFKPEIAARRKRNEEKESREEKERLRAERAEEAKGYAAARKRRPATPIERFKPDDFAPLAAQDLNHVESSEDGVGATQHPTSPMWRQAGSAFASLASPGTSPMRSRTVWGTAVVGQPSPDFQPLDDKDPMPDDGWLQGWEGDLLNGEDLIAQMAKTSLEPDPPAQGFGRKRKGKKITLMTTNARRGA